jgi:hypothetical protein
VTQAQTVTVRAYAGSSAMLTVSASINGTVYRYTLPVFHAAQQ